MTPMTVDLLLDIPTTSALYQIKSACRYALREKDKSTFFELFLKVMSERRDYRQIGDNLLSAAIQRGYGRRTDIARNNYNVHCRGYCMQVSGNPYLLSDLIIAAILMCPITDEDIYE